MALCYDMRKGLSSVITIYGVESRYDFGNVTPVLMKSELLAALDRKGIANARIGEVLGLPSSRVSEIFRAIRPNDKKPRELTYDEGVKLFRTFLAEEQKQEPSRPAAALPPSMLRLAVLHIANILGTQPSDQQVDRLTEDLRAWLRYAASPTALDTEQAATAYFQALADAREDREEEAQPESDPGRSR